MAEFNLKMIKIFFAVVIAMLVLAMTGGMNILRNKEFFDWQKLSMEADYVKYKRVLAAQNENERTAGSFAGEIKNAKSVPVLLYHGIIVDNNWEEDGTNITLEGFQEHMYALKRAGYRTISIADFNEFMRQKKDLPDKSILITFDDGRKDSYFEADPVFRALDFNAVMFLIAGRSLGENAAGDNFYLGKKELQDMIRSGRWEIQSHGDFDHNWEKISEKGEKGHFLSNRLWLSAPKNRNETADEAKKRILSDLGDSKKKIESELGQKVFAYAYPFNDFGQSGINFPESQKFIAENISSVYPLTFFQEEKNESIANLPDSKTFMIKRINVDSSMPAAELLRILENNREKNLPWRDSFGENRGWTAKWGETKIWGDLTLGENEKQGGNMTVLSGSSLWKDYLVKSDIYLTGGASISQVVRYDDEANYAACDFDTAEISVLQKINGEIARIGVKTGDYAKLTNTNNEIAVRVQGNTISCYLNGKKELEGRLKPPVVSSGGIGFSFWDDLSNNAVARVKKIEAMPL